MYVVTLFYAKMNTICLLNETIRDQLAKFVLH